MKNIVSIVAAIMVGTFFTGAFAAPARTDVVVVPHYEDNSIIDVSGVIEGATVGGSKLVLKFTDMGADTESADDDKVLFMDVTKTYREGGVVKYAFDTLYLPTDLATGDYAIDISGSDLTEPLPVYKYKYSVPLDTHAVLWKLKEATEETICDVFDANAEKIGLDTSVFDTFKTDAESKAAFAELMTKVNYDGIAAKNEEVLSTIIASNEVIKKRVSDVLFEASAIGAFVDIKDATDFEKWFNRYYKTKYKTVDGVVTEEKEKTLEFDTNEPKLLLEDGEDPVYESILEKVMNGADFKKRVTKVDEKLVSNGVEIGNIKVSDVQTYLYESALLSAICDRTKSEVREIFETYSSYFESLEISEFNALSDIDKGRVIGKVQGNSYETTALAGKAFNDAIEGITDSDPPSDSGSQGGGKGGFALQYEDKKQEAAEEKADIFGDLNGVEWAKAAIEYLYNEGVVNGKAHGVFAPNDNVTRAEFIKMTVEALEISKGEFSHPFTDVADDSWYAPYIAAAYDSGVIFGTGTGRFNPEESITREDMATILYRVLGAKAPAAELNFSDAENISDYAKAAVAYFAEKGIVNGVGDGNFAPKNNATRAETAVIIYRIIK